jgi:hypothetical protein
MAAALAWMFANLSERALKLVLLLLVCLQLLMR